MAQQLDERFARHFLERLLATVNAHDAEAVAALCTEDVVWEDPAEHEGTGAKAALRFKFAAEHAVEANGHPRYARMPAAYLRYVSRSWRASMVGPARCEDWI